MADMGIPPPVKAAGAATSKDRFDDPEYWIKEIDKSGDHFKAYEDRSWKIVERYRADSNDQPRNTYNVLYANTEVMRGVIYQKAPTPKVKRRFLDEDPIGKLASEILERTLVYCMDSYDFDELMRRAVDDRLLVAQGIARVRYVPSIQDDVVYDEKCISQYVPWNMFRTGIATRWERVPWIAYGELLSRDDLKKQFPEIYKDVSLTWSETGKESAGEGADGEPGEAQTGRRAIVWTVWNKTNRKVYVVSPGYKDDFLVPPVDDPLHLEGFFPCPKPLYGTTTNNSMIPVPDYVQYQDQAREMDELTARISNIVQALRVRGVYDGSIEALKRLANAGDNEYIPVMNYAALVEKGGLKNAIFELPIEGLASVAVQLYQQREQVKKTIYEISGVSDILRGSSSASETLGAQELKSQYAQSRISASQKAVANFARDLIRIKAEIIAEHFAPELLMKITGLQVPPEVFMQAVQLLRDGGVRDYRIEIETDSTLEPDQKAQKQQVLESINSLGVMLQSVAPAVEAGAMTKDAAKQLIKSAIRRFDYGDEVEAAMDVKEPEGPTPEQQKAQADQQAQAAKAAEQKAKLDGDKEITAMNNQTDLKKTEMQLSANRELEIIKTFGTLQVPAPNGQMLSPMDFLAQFSAQMQQSTDIANKLLMGLEATIQQVILTQQQLANELNKPIVVQRDATGRIVALERIQPTIQ